MFLFSQGNEFFFILWYYLIHYKNSYLFSLSQMTLFTHKIPSNWLLLVNVHIVLKIFEKIFPQCNAHVSKENKYNIIYCCDTWNLNKQSNTAGKQWLIHWNDRTLTYKWLFENNLILGSMLDAIIRQYNTFAQNLHIFKYSWNLS